MIPCPKCGLSDTAKGLRQKGKTTRHEFSIKRIYVCRDCTTPWIYTFDFKTGVEKTRLFLQVVRSQAPQVL